MVLHRFNKTKNFSKMVDQVTSAPQNTTSPGQPATGWKNHIRMISLFDTPNCTATMACGVPPRKLMMVSYQSRS